MPGQALFTRQPELAVRRTGGVDDRSGLVLCAAAELDLLDGSVERELYDVVVQDLGAELLGLLLHLGHEFGALDRLGEAREVLDLGRIHQLAADLDRTRHDEG